MWCACVVIAVVASSTIAYDFSDTEHYYPYETGYLSDVGGQDWSVFSGGRLQQPKCIDIPRNLTLCKDIGYTQMRLPNLLEHDSLREVTQQASSWVALTNVNCHPDTQLFLCSLFSPVCLDRPIPPCRNLCTAVRDACLGKMLSYGFPWPEMLRCDKFPMENDLCIGPQTENKPDESVCAACNHPKTFEAIVDAYCQADFVMRFKADEIVVSGPDLRVTANRRKKIFKKGGLKKRDLQQLIFYVEGGLKCDCKELEQSGSSARSGTDYIGMGQKIGDKIMLSFVQRYDKKDPGLKKALRAIRKETVCRDGIKVITGEGSEVESKESEAQDEAEVVEIITGRKKGKKNRHREQEREETPQEVVNTPQPEPEEEVTESNAASSGRKSERKGNRNRDKNTKKRRPRDRAEREERRGRRKRKEAKEEEDGA